MRKFIFVAAVGLCAAVLVPSLLAQDTAYDVEGWKRRVASPTYGITAAFMQYEDNDGGNKADLIIPGLEMRIFNGINVAKRGGFFTGYEVGTIFFYLRESDEYTAVTYLSDPATTSVTFRDYMVSTVFLMSKYGYRLDLGVKAVGLSLGLELGIGGQMSIGSVDVYSGGAETITTTDGQVPFSVILDGAVEAALRLGQNFRLFGRVGPLVYPPTIELDDASFDDAPDAYFNANIVPVMLSMRLGFALNY